VRQPQYPSPSPCKSEQALHDTGSCRFCKTWNIPNSPVPNKLADKVPRGNVSMRGFRYIKKIYRVNVPGNANRSAAVALCRNRGDIQKYAGKTAAYMHTDSTVKAYRTGLLGNLSTGKCSAIRLAMLHPKDTDAIESEKVKTVFPSPSINYLSGENSSTAPVSKRQKDLHCETHCDGNYQH